MAEFDIPLDNVLAASSENEQCHNPKGGRPIGRRNRDKVQLQTRIQKKEHVIFSQLMKWVQSPDPYVSLPAIRQAMLYGWGRPPDRLLVGNLNNKPFVIASPTPVQTFEDWERLVHEAEGFVVDASSQDGARN